MGLFGNESESILAMKEAVDNYYSPAQLRKDLSADYQEQLYNNNLITTNITLQQLASIFAEHEQPAREIVLICGTMALSALLYEKAKIIIWDELPMANKAVLECVDLLLKEICGKNELFGGKPFVGVRDFQQVALVIKAAGKSATINVSINTSYLWKHFNIYTLNQPIQNANDSVLAEFIDNIDENCTERE
ncbi:31830_t:CDS:2, partial [Gigaspora margarita]